MSAETDIAAINDGGVNTALEVRTALTSVLARADVMPVTPGSYDDYFNDASLTGWTTLTVTGSQTITEAPLDKEPMLSVKFVSQSSGDLNALLKSGGTISTGTTITTGLRTYARANYDLAGICFADGTTSGSNVHAALAYTATSRLSVFNGSFTANTEVYANSWSYGVAGKGSWLYLKLEYVSANTWTAYVSPDGISWITYDASRAFTMTPTHFGLVWSSSSGASDNIATFKHFIVE